MKSEIEKQKTEHMHEIQHLFMYTYKDQWISGTMFAHKSRLWVQAFNELVKEGFIERKKEYPGYKYKWKAQTPAI